MRPFARLIFSGAVAWGPSAAPETGALDLIPTREAGAAPAEAEDTVEPSPRDELAELEFEELPEPEPEPESEEEPPPPPPDEAVSTDEATPTPDLQPRIERPRTGPQRRAFQFPRVWFGFGVSPGTRSIGFGVGVTYFLIPHVGAGLDLDDTVHINSPFTFNIFDLTPTLTLLAMPRYRFSPLLKAGFGGSFVSHHGGSYARWVGTGGAALRLGKRFIATTLVGVDGLLPDARFRRNFRCTLAETPCSLGLVVELGIGFGF